MSKDERALASTGVSPQMPRRRFLMLGSAAMASVITTDISADIIRTVLSSRRPAPRLSLGYIAATLGQFKSRARVTAAEQLRSSDPALPESVLLRVHGLVRPDETEPVSMSLDVHYLVSAAGDMRIPFHAWMYNATRKHEIASAPAGFTVPISPARPLVLSVASKSAKGTTEAMASLHSGTARGANKLRRGLYCLALVEGDKAPDWSGIRAVPKENQKLPVLEHLAGIGYKPVPFPYIVLSADLT